MKRAVPVVINNILIARSFGPCTVYFAFELHVTLLVTPPTHTPPAPLVFLKLHNILHYTFCRNFGRRF